MTIYIILNSSIELIRKENSTPSPHFLLVWMFENKCKYAVSYLNNIWTTFQKMISIVFRSFSLGYFFFRLNSFGTQRWKLDNWSHHTIQFYQSPPLRTVSKAQRGEQMSCSKEFMHKKAALHLNEWFTLNF